MKKIFGYIFICLAFIFTMAFMTQFGEFIKSIIGLIKSIVGESTPYDAGYALGGFLLYIIILAITISLWLIGLKWIKYKPL